MPVHDANAAGDRLSGEAGRIADAFAASVARRSSFDAPYRHYLLESLFPADVADALANLPFAAPDLGGVSGRRELHNDSRSYFDAAAMARFPVMRAVAEALAIAANRPPDRRSPSPRRSTTHSCGSNTRRTSTASGSSRTPISG